MQSSISMAQLKAIYVQHGAVVSDSDLVEVLEQCNDQADEVYTHCVSGDPLPVRSALDWAHYFAKDEARTQWCEALSIEQFHTDAYGY